MLSLQHTLPAWLIRGQDNTSSMPVYVDGVQTKPTSGTYTLLNESGSAVVSAQAVSFSGQTPYYTVSAATLPTTLQLSWYYQEQWALVVAGVTHTLRRSAWLVRGVPYSGITFDDLVLHEDQLSALRSTDVDPRLEGKINIAWQRIMAELIAMGRRPPLLLDSWQLREWHKMLALHLAYKAAGAAHKDSAAYYHEMVKEAKSSISLSMDFDEDGQIDSAEEGIPAVPPLALSSGAVGRWRW